MPERPADLILRNAAVYTADAARTLASAVAIRDGRIVAVGHDGDLAGLVGASSEVIDCEGRSVLPAFQDAHTHPALAGVGFEECHLFDLAGEADYLAAIARYVAERPDPWITGGGWSSDAFGGGYAFRAALDGVVADRPAYLVNRDGHSAWANSRALELAGVTAATPDPPGGRIERDPSGLPSGALHEDAMGLVERLVPPVDQAGLERALLRAQSELHALGVAAWNDASVEEPALEAYRALLARGALTMRCTLSLLWDRARGPEQVADLIARRASIPAGERVRPTTVKFFQDGVMETFTASLLAPYLQGRGHCPSLIAAADLARYVTLVDREGFAVHVHAIGDRAVREALDAFATALDANGRRDSRHHIAHVQLIDPADLPRFRSLGVIANCQPYWACTSGGYLTDLTIPFIGADRGRYIYPFGSLRRAGAQLAFGSDWNVSTADPLDWIEVAVERVDVTDRGDAPFLPDERLDLGTALDATTIGAAFVNGIDGETGSVEVGKAADLVLLDRDLFDRGCGPIADARVELTLVDGRRVYEAAQRG